MEITLKTSPVGQVSVTCDGTFSHTFNLDDLPPIPPADQLFKGDPVAMGKRLFAALFKQDSAARSALDAGRQRILLVAEEDALDAFPWEYLYGPDGYLVLDHTFVRGLPVERRQPAPDLTGIPLHIVATLANPLSGDLDKLDSEGEWDRLKGCLEGMQEAILLDRARPPTLDSARGLLAGRRHGVLHFIGHGKHTAGGACVCFEQACGDEQPVGALDLARRVADTALLVSLNACTSAAPGEMPFANIARTLVGRGVPYGLGMRFKITDEDAKALTGTFYDELAKRSSLEEALRQARNRLTESQNPWATGIPVLYTALDRAASAFETPAGPPTIKEHQTPRDVSELRKAEGVFCGRLEELLRLGNLLTASPPRKLLTIHGAGGQGKTALAREAVERFGWAWPGGVWAVSLESLPTRQEFCLQLAKMLGLLVENFPQPEDLERALLRRLSYERSLVVLDNAETLEEGLKAGNGEAISLANFFRLGLLGTSASLLFTARGPLGWLGEEAIPLGGLSPDDGAALFHQCASQRQGDIKMDDAKKLSQVLEGSPLALRLLGLAFNETQVPLERFISDYEEHLRSAEDRFCALDGRQRTLFACIDASMRYLDAEERALLSGLWIFKSPFLPDIAAQIFTPPDLAEGEAQAVAKAITERLYRLSRRGLLEREEKVLADGRVLLYRSLPVVRLYARHFLEQALDEQTLRQRMGAAHDSLLRKIRNEMDSTARASYLAVRCRADLEAASAWVEEAQRGGYCNHLGWVLQRLGDRQAGLGWLERALSLVQGRDQDFELNILNNMANVYQQTGKPEEALQLFREVLPIIKEVGDRAGEASTLNNMAWVYKRTGNPEKALELYRQALPIAREVGNRAGEATTLNNMATMYGDTGNPIKALELYGQALPIRREVGDRAGEAATLTNIAGVYGATGKLEKALELYGQALPMMREVRDRAGEAATLNNMAGVYGATGKLEKALELYGQALPIRREVGDRAGEATTLNGMAGVYQSTGKPEAALQLFQEALPITKEVGNRAWEAMTLNNIASVYQATGKPEAALQLFQEALPIMKEVGNRAGEAVTLNGMALVYQDTGKPEEALRLYREALPIMREVGNRAGEAVTNFIIAFLLRTLGQDSAAITCLRQAVQLEKEVSHPDYEEDTALLRHWEEAFARGVPLP